MGFLDNLNPIKWVVDTIRGTADEYIRSPEERDQFHLKLAEIESKHTAQFEETLRTELQAKERILVAELGQDDNYTKRARPTIVYVGLLLAVLELVARYYSYFSGMELPGPSSMVPREFWLGWSGVTATWAVGRSMEKRAKIKQEEAGRLTSLLTGG